MKILNDGVTFFENPPTIQTDQNGNIIIMDDLLYPIKGMSKEDCISLYIVQSNSSNNPRIIYKQVGNPGETFTIPPFIKSGTTAFIYSISFIISDEVIK